MPHRHYRKSRSKQEEKQLILGILVFVGLAAVVCLMIISGFFN